MSHDKTQTNKITLNAQKATWLLEETESFVADRPLSMRHVDKLVSEMREGKFMSEITIIIVANLKGTIYRLNGQHTATAVLKICEEDESFSIPGVTLLTYTVKDEVELRQLYARIDRGATRTNVHVTNSILVGTAEFARTSARVLTLLPQGLAFMRFEHSDNRKIYAGESAAYDVQHEYLKLSQKIGAFMDEFSVLAIHHGHMFRVPVVAALYATFSVDEEDAVRFWRAVATGIGLTSENEPAARLRQMLQNSKISGREQHRSSKNRLGAEDMYRACLHAWNR